MEFETRTIHAGQEPDPSTGAVTVPVYQTSTYAQEAVGRLKDGYDYSRTATRPRRALEECLASLESTHHGIAFASGMAAATTVVRLIDPSRIVSMKTMSTEARPALLHGVDQRLPLPVRLGGRVRQRARRAAAQRSHWFHGDRLKPAAEDIMSVAAAANAARSAGRSSSSTTPSRRRALRRPLRQRRPRRALDDRVSEQPFRPSSAASRPHPTTAGRRLPLPPELTRRSTEPFDAFSSSSSARRSRCAYARSRTRQPWSSSWAAAAMSWTYSTQLPGRPGMRSPPARCPDFGGSSRSSPAPSSGE